jgi:hypothetical protein
MNRTNCKYLCILKGNWQERFFELIELFQIGLHKKFAIGVPANLNDQYNRIVIYGISVPEECCVTKNNEVTDDEIFNSFYSNKPDRPSNGGNADAVSESGSSAFNFFDKAWSYN